MLSFATARVNARQRTIVRIACGVLGLMTLAALPFARAHVSLVPSFIPMFSMAMFGSAMLATYLIVGQFRSARFLPLAILSGGFLFAALMVVPYVMAFPGVLAPLAITASRSSGAWCWALWHFGFQVAMVAYIVAEARVARRLSVGAARLVLGLVVGLTVAAVVLCTLVAVFWATALPGLEAVDNPSPVFRTGLFAALLVFGIGSLITAALVTRGRTVIQLWVMVALASSCCAVLLSLASGGRLTLGWYLARVEMLVALVAVLVAFLHEVMATSAGLAELATIDGLTGIGNRRFYDDRIEAVYRDALRHGGSLGIILIDVDYFKPFNDAYGHLAGDDTLRLLASVMKESLGRSIDVVARVGGEEFAVLLPESDCEGTRVVAERIRMGIGALAIAHAGAPGYGHVTVSLGVTALVAGEPVANLVARADAALYRAKSLGRNRVVVFEAPQRPVVRTL